MCVFVYAIALDTEVGATRHACGQKACPGRNETTALRRLQGPKEQ